VLSLVQCAMHTWQYTCQHLIWQRIVHVWMLVHMEYEMCAHNMCVCSTCTVHSNKHSPLFWNKKEIMNIKKNPVEKNKMLSFHNFSIFWWEYLFSGFVFMLHEGEPYVYTTAGTSRTCLSPFVKTQTIFSWAAPSCDWLIERKICYFCLLSLRNMGSSLFRICKLIVSRYSCKMPPLGLSLDAIARCCLSCWHQSSPHTLHHAQGEMSVDCISSSWSHLLFLQMRRWLVSWRGSMQNTDAGLLSPQALYLIRTFTVTLLHSTASLYLAAALHVSTYPVPLLWGIIRYCAWTTPQSVHPVINDPCFLYWHCVSLLRVLLDESTAISIVTGVQVGHLRNCGSYSVSTRDFSWQTSSAACLASFSAYWGSFSESRSAGEWSWPLTSTCWWG
jgi:hypothetical protein